MSQREGRIAIAQTCGRWGGHGFDEALYRALRRNGLSASPVWGDTLADSDELRQHVVVFRIDKEEEATTNSNHCAKDDDRLDIEKDRASHPLLRAARLHAAKEAAAMNGHDRGGAWRARGVPALRRAGMTTTLTAVHAVVSSRAVVSSVVVFPVDESLHGCSV